MLFFNLIHFVVKGLDAKTVLKMPVFVATPLTTGKWWLYLAFIDLPTERMEKTYKLEKRYFKQKKSSI